MTELSSEITKTNDKLRSVGVRVTIEQRGSKLSLRAILPPKPGSGKDKPYQQYLSLGVGATIAGLQFAEAEAKRVAAALDMKQFDWTPYLGEQWQKRDTCGHWIKQFEKDYFVRRPLTDASRYTWEKDYQVPFKKLPQEEPLTKEILVETIAQTEPDSRARKRYCLAFSALAKFADIPFDAKRYRGNYQSAEREIPKEEEIIRAWDSITNPAWKNVVALIALYGLRAHEVFFLDFARYPILRVTEGKTDDRDVYPYPVEWCELFKLEGIGKDNLPECNGTHTDLGHRVTTQFARYKLPFKPHDLRHAHAIRMISYRVPIEVQARYQGHSVAVHTRTYQRWLKQEHLDKEWEKSIGVGQASPKP